MSPRSGRSKPAKSSHRTARPSPAAEPVDPSRARARGAALAGAVALLALWAIAPIVPGMWLWGVNVLRFAGPAGWALWAGAALLAALAVAGRIGRPMDRLGASFDRHPTAGALALAVITVAVVLALPDRLYFTGDFLFRRGLNEVELQKSDLAPQLMPLDRLLHLQIAPMVRDGLGLTTVDTDRWIGAFDAALLALATAFFVRALGARGGAALALAMSVVFGGGLAIFTGYGKSFVEMSVLVVALAGFGLVVVGRGRHWIPLALAACAYLGLHRTGFVVLPAVATAGIVGWRRHAADRSTRGEAIAAGVILVAGVAILAPHALSILRTYDAAHHVPGAGGPASGAGVAAIFAPLRLLDLANVALLLVPLLPAGLAAVVARPRIAPAGETAFLGALAASFALLAFASFPQQGLVRDVDVFAPNGFAWTCLTAAALWAAFNDRRASHATALVVAALALATSLTWIVHAHDSERGFARVRAVIAGPPARTSGERSSSFDFLGATAFRSMRYADAADAYREAARLTPNPRYFVQWAVAAKSAGRYDEARGALREAVGRNPSLTPAWLMLAGLAGQAGDYVEADRAWQAIAVLSPDDPAVAQNAAQAHAQLEASRRSPPER